MKRTLVLFAAAATLVAAGTASAGSRGTDYAAYAGDPVKEIRYYQIYNWQRTGKEHLVIWTKPSTAYLLTVPKSCAKLIDTRMTIEIGGVASIKGRLQAGSDDVLIGDLHCRINEIRPIDMARLKAARA
jgi:hypothetical protein